MPLRSFDELGLVTVLCGAPCRRKKNAPATVVCTPGIHAASNGFLGWLRHALAVSQLAAISRALLRNSSLIDGYVSANAIDVWVMGAYGHSRIRHLIVGSTTTAMRTSAVGALVGFGPYAADEPIVRCLDAGSRSLF